MIDQSSERLGATGGALLPAKCPMHTVWALVLPGSESDERVKGLSYQREGKHESLRGN